MPAASSCLYQVIGADNIPLAMRSAFWRDASLRGLEIHEPADAAGGPFDANIRRLIAPEGRLIDLRTISGGLGRTSRLCRADGIDDIVLILTLSGDGAGWFGDPDQATRLSANRSLLHLRDEGRPFAVRWTRADNHTLHLDLPRADFDKRTLNRILAGNGAWLSSGGLAPMLAAQMRALAEIAPNLDPAARAAGLSAVLDLAATVLRLEFGSASPESEVCEDGMLIAAQALIRRRFASPDLSPEEIAHRLGCSRAHPYRLFARHGLTVAGYLRETRLQRCRAALAAAGPREMVGDIAFRCGFDNPVYFAHLFYQRFGMRPSEAHAAAAEK
ncbi:MAG: helix-turn-helix domain-containing protein [Stellaceae bacterium]